MQIKCKNLRKSENFAHPARSLCPSIEKKYHMATTAHVCMCMWLAGRGVVCELASSFIGQLQGGGGGEEEHVVG